MEKILFSFLIKTKMSQVEIELESGNIAIAPIAAAVGETTKPEAARLASVGGQKKLTLKLEELDSWLAAIPGKSPVLKQFRANLAATIRIHSVDLKAQDALQEMANEAAYATGAVLIGEELTGPDLFRKDASRGFDRMMPDIIDHTAESGTLDLFIQGRSEEMWGQVFTPELVHVPITIGSEYNEHTIGDMRRANAVVMTGPQISAKQPEFLQKIRRYIPERQSVRIVDGKPKTVLIPRHPEVFAWEMAVMKGASDGKAVELPGSPYNGKRPFWIDE